ncbi:Scr1 family TA system antitoxin-like transcriptional regulator [Streptomyces asiaticus]|uniref:Scr1 family TA system antitoxin-like transcriptional regulator n=1 Tax=Streptomyces asiaticus TaxID=114695 RepID=UPI0039BE8CA2
MAELNTVYVEHPVSSAFLGDQAHLAQYGTAFERLTTAALPPIDPGPEREHGGRGMGGAGLAAG